jgi:hypothetical protein
MADQNNQSSDAEKYTRLGIGVAEMVGVIVGGVYGVDTTGINTGVNTAVNAGFQSHSNQADPASGQVNPPQGGNTNFGYTDPGSK